MAGKHPIHIHPVRPLYRFAATGLGASMWFFVRNPPSKFAKVQSLMIHAVDVSGEERRYHPAPPATRPNLTYHRSCLTWMEAPMGPLNNKGAERSGADDGKDLRIDLMDQDVSSAVEDSITGTASPIVEKALYT